MRATLQIARSELTALFYSPIAWLLLIIFITQNCMRFFPLLEYLLRNQNQSGLIFYGITETLFSITVGTISVAQSTIFLYVPLLTMGLISRELQSGSIKLLLSSPTRISEFVFGKYLAVVAYCLLLALALVGIMVVGGQTVEYLDYPAVLSGILGVFLLACTFAAIGLFMSSLTPYQMVAAVSTLAVLAAFNFIGDVGQDIPIFNKIAYWLSLLGRVDFFRSGLISTKHVFYFVSIIGMFLSFTILKLSSGRKIETTAAKASKYGAIALVTIVFGYITSIPVLTGSFDMTRIKTQSLTEASVEIINGIEGPWKITNYVNVLGANFAFGRPLGRNRDFDRFEHYLRYNPELEMEYVHYYAPTANNKYIYENNPGKSDEELVRQFDAQGILDFEDVLTPMEISEVVDLEPEKNRFIRRVEGNGRSALIRMYDDPEKLASEKEISAALKRLIIGPKNVAVVTGHGERSAHTKGDGRSYQRTLTDVTYRQAMISHGFDVMEVSLDEPIPYDTDILIVADPKIAYSGDELQRIETYIAGGGNLLITAEPGGQDILNPIIEKLGARILPGQMFQEQEELPAEAIFANYTEDAFRYSIEPPGLLRTRPLIFPGTAGLIAFKNTRYTVAPILVSKKDVAWHKKRDNPATFNEVTLDLTNASETSTPLALALSRDVEGHEQRIMIVGDADFMSNAGLSTVGTPTNNHDFVSDLFTWLSNSEYPINTERMDFPDKRVLVDRIGIKWLKVAFFGAIPLVLLILGTILLLRRRRQ